MNDERREFSFIDDHFSLEARSILAADHQIYWDGFVYLDGFRAGEPSVREFLNRLKTGSLSGLTQSLHGAFLMIIRESSGVAKCFIDDSGMTAAFYSNRGVSSSYLNLIKRTELRSNQVDRKRIAESLESGFTASGLTHFPQIRKIAGNEILEYAPGKPVAVHLKDSHEVADEMPANSSIVSAFSGLKTAVSETSISVDVTGGIDTRTLIALLIGAGIDFETSGSGTADHPDILLGEEVARAAGKQFHPSIHDSSDFAERLEETLFSLDGLRTYISAQHRLNQMQRARRSRGIQLSMKGLGGELYRDYAWPKNYSWLWNSSPEMRQYYKTHLYSGSNSFNAHFTDSFRSLARSVQEERINRLTANFSFPSPTQSYDYMHQCEAVRISGSYALSVASVRSMPCHAPLAEVSRLRYPFHTPRLKRVGGYYQRKIISGVNPALANVMSTYGSVLSADVGVLFSSSVQYLTNKVKQRITRDYSELTRARGGAPSQADCQRMLINSPVTAKAMSRLVDADVIRSDVSPHDIPYELLERCVSVGWLLDYADEA